MDYKNLSHDELMKLRNDAKDVLKNVTTVLQRRSQKEFQRLYKEQREAYKTSVCEKCKQCKV